jgi:3-hydroxyisobutyrate dehydrogenase-like beta-hydroxyacid dehydrogenase
MPWRAPKRTAPDAEITTERFDMIVGCIGLGRMGGPMARCIAGAGHEVILLDVSTDALSALADLGAPVADGLAEIAAKAEVILTSLPSPREVEDVITGEGGLLGALREGTIILETSTTAPPLSVSLAAACAERGAILLDAPISGGVVGARDGTLTVMVGGDADAFERARPVLDAIGTKVRHVGPNGAGDAAKLINQMVFLTHAAVLCESVAFGDRCDLDPAALLDVLETSMAGQPLATGWHNRMPTDDIEGGFQVYRVLKDLRLGREAKDAVSASTPVFDAALAAFENAQEMGFGEVDLTVLRRIAAGTERRGE